MNKTLSFINKNKVMIIFLGCLIGFFALVKNVFFHEIMEWDVKGYAFVSRHLISESMTPIMKMITNFGGVFVIVILTLLAIICVKNKKIKMLVPMNLIFITLLNQVFKNVLQRPRPTEFRIVDETGYSFPSGHSMVSMAFYGYFIYLIYKYVENKYLKWILIVLLSLLIGSIGISRIYLGVHYTTDVLGGFLFSIMYLIVFVKMTENKQKKEEQQIMKGSLLKSFQYAFEGIWIALKTERNLHIHVLSMCLVVICGFVFKINIYEWIVCIILFVIVISAELFNTAIEATVDIAMPNQHDLAKKAKDVAAGAVLITAIGAAIIGMMIFIPKMICLF